MGLVHGGACGQGKHPVSGRTPPPSASVVGVSLDSLRQAVRSVDYSLSQRRAFFGRNGSVVMVRESVQVDADGSDSPPYAAAFAGVEGELPGSPVWQTWANKYSRNVDFLHQHGGFQVRELGLAQQNYTLHSFGQAVRLGRNVERTVVFPNSLDKAIWYLEVDEATNVPLFTAEFNAQFRLLSAIEVTSFTPSVQAITPNQPTMVMTEFPTIAAAVAAIGATNLVEPSSSCLGEFAVHRVQVSTNPLNNRQSLVVTYTDGVDEFFVVESPGVPDFFAGMPTHQDDSSGSHTISRYRDAAMTELSFWDDGVAFQVSGRGSLVRLDGVAKFVLTQAVLGN